MLKLKPIGTVRKFPRLIIKGCTRCSGLLIQEMDDEFSCITCGAVIYVSDMWCIRCGGPRERQSGRCLVCDRRFNGE